MSKQHPIGIFDSGIGGLTVANAIFDLLPSEHLIYFGDTAHIPYGTKPASQIHQFSIDICRFLIEDQRCKAVVVACNTASAAALPQMREHWPDIPIIGMEPAVKPAVAATQSHKIGVLATAGTFGSERYDRLVQRFAKATEVFENPCIGLVEKIEAGLLDAPETQFLLQQILHPMLLQGVDTFVLGCTHYPLLHTQIQAVVGPGKHLIDPAPAVARQLQRRLQALDLLRTEAPKAPHQFYISKMDLAFAQTLKRHAKAPYTLSELAPSSVFSSLN